MSFARPSDMTAEECCGIEAALCTNDADRFPSTITQWQLDPEELEKIKETGTISVVMPGKRVQPMFLTVHDPFEDHGFVPVVMPAQN